MNDGIRNENLICTQNSYFILIKLYNWLRTALIISKCSTWPINTIHKWLLLNSYDCILHSLKHSSVNFVFIRTHPKQPFFTFPATPTLWSSGGGRSPTDLENYDVRCVKKKKKHALTISPRFRRAILNSSARRRVQIISQIAGGRRYHWELCHISMGFCLLLLGLV